MQVPLFGVSKTPRIIKILIWITVIASVGAPFLSFLLAHYFQLPGPSLWFSLNLEGLKMGWLWQPLTYFFLHTASTTISLSLLFSLFFHMLLFWFAGSQIVIRSSPLSLLGLYLGGGLVGGILSSLLILSTSSTLLLVGSGPALFALLTAWATLFADFEFALFFVWRLKAKMLILILLALSLLSHFIHGEWIHALAILTGSLYGLLFAHITWKCPWPFKVSSKRESNNSQEIEVEVTVIKEKSDEEFMDQMLEKISRLGKDSLTEKEKKRMDEISKRK